jgi:hypothetical protein
MGWVRSIPNDSQTKHDTTQRFTAVTTWIRARLLWRGCTWHRPDYCNNIYSISNTIYTQTWEFYDHEYHVLEILRLSHWLVIYGNQLVSHMTAMWGVLCDVVLTIVTTFTLYVTQFILKLENFTTMNTTYQIYSCLSCRLGIYGKHLNSRTSVTWGRTWYRVDHCNNIYAISGTIYAQTSGFYAQTWRCAHQCPHRASPHSIESKIMHRRSCWGQRYLMRSSLNHFQMENYSPIYIVTYGEASPRPAQPHPAPRPSAHLAPRVW